jgi:tetratricopeptide (TPR) repeat protein
MRKNSDIYGIVMILMLVLFTGGCSSVIKEVKKVIQPKSKTEKSATPKVEKPKSLPTPLPPLTPKVKRTSEPKPTAKPEPTPLPEPTKAPNVQAIIQNGIAYHEAGDIKKAIATFERALEFDPGNAEATQYLEEARTELQALITMHLNKGLAYFNQEALEDAIQEWDKVLALDPSNQKAAEYKQRAQKQLDAIGKQ